MTALLSIRKGAYRISYISLAIILQQRPGMAVGCREQEREAGRTDEILTVVSVEVIGLPLLFPSAPNRGACRPAPSHTVKMLGFYYLS